MNLQLQTNVVSILKVKTEDGIVKYQVKTDKATNSEVYDAIIVAVPLEVPSDYISCDLCTHWADKKDMQHFQQTVATFVQGIISGSPFGLKDASQVPEALFTTETPKLFYSSIGKQKDVEKSKIRSISPPVYKLFSREPVTEKQINYLFTSKKDVKAIDWLAYPHYNPPEKLMPFVLDDGVFYVNAIERAASAMEMSAIGGRNAALLTQKYLKSTVPRKSGAQDDTKKETLTHTEL